jgi:hypothetical protein
MYVVPVSVISSAVSFLILPAKLSVLFFTLFLMSQIILWAVFKKTLSSYLNFSVKAIFEPSIRHFSFLIILCICIIYYFSIESLIRQEGFTIPDAIVDTAIGLTSNITGVSNITAPQLSIPEEQINLLRENPSIMEQYGLSPQMLDSINPQSENTSDKTSQNATKNLISEQFQNLIAPYTNIIPLILTILLFFGLTSLSSILTSLTTPLMWLVFKILEKTGFVKFTTEMRPVKKMVI